MRGVARFNPGGIVMKDRANIAVAHRVAAALAAASIVALVAFRPAHVTAADAQIPPNPKVHIQYLKPQSAVLAPLRQRLMDRKILEEYSQFLSPLQLKQDLTVSTEECPDVRINSDYNPAKHYIRICYEYLSMVENETAMPPDRLPPLYALAGAGLMPEFSRDEIIIGGFIFVLLHETGHAVFDIQGVPRLGHEEDAADEIAGFMMLQFGKDPALTMVKGAINVDHEMDVSRQFNTLLMADVHSLDIQRYENILCLGLGHPQYGSAFKELADKYLPDARIPNCKLEYEQANRAFNATIMPYVDKEALKKVLGMRIFTAADQKL
jgi:hypothetical protein